MASLVGQTLLGRYRIEELVGRGGMAEVYKAWDTRRNYHVAIKVMREDLAEDIEFVRRFKREAGALAELAHANVVRFYSFERAGPLAFIVMDYIEGTTLRRRILEAEGSPLPFDEVLSITQQVCAALHYAHQENVLHRDVKPGNIMIQPDPLTGTGGRVLLSDFGIAKAADAATATTVMPGTPAYMSPEQCRSEPLDVRTDIYSLGILVYEMLTGRRPFAGESEGSGTGSTRERIRWEQMHAAPPSLRQFNPALPRQAEEVVLKALAKERADRWPSALAFWQALAEALGASVSELAAVPAVPSPAVPKPQAVAPPPAAPPPTAPEPAPQTAWMAGIPLGAWAVIGATLFGLLIVIAALILKVPTGSDEVAYDTHTPTIRPTATSEPASTPTLQPTAATEPTSTPTIRPTATSEPISTPTRTPEPKKPTPTHTPKPKKPTETPTEVPSPTPPRPTSTPTLAALQKSLTADPVFGAEDIFVVDHSTGARINITNHPQRDLEPVWSPDGRKVAFVSDRLDGNKEVYVMNADGSKLGRLTVDAGTDESPIWTLDGKKIIFASDRYEKADLFMMNLDGSGLVNLTNHPAADTHPRLTSDGQSIVFDSDRGMGPQKHVMSVKGGPAALLSGSVEVFAQFHFPWEKGTEEQ